MDAEPMQLSASIIGSAVQYSWTWDPVIVSGLIFSLLLYLLGVVRSYRQSLLFPLIQSGCFAMGWLTLIAALLSPLHEMGESLFSAHMVQHELLMAVAAPLLIIGRPDLIYIWA